MHWSGRRTEPLIRALGVNALIDRSPRCRSLHVSQMRASAQSITANISEGLGRRPAESVQYSTSSSRGRAECALSPSATYSGLPILNTTSGRWNVRSRPRSAMFGASTSVMPACIATLNPAIVRRSAIASKARPAASRCSTSSRGARAMRSQARGARSPIRSAASRS